VAIHSGDAEAMGGVLDRRLEDGELIPLCGGVRVIHMPGHTPGSICLLHGDALITGDVLIGGRRGLKPPSSISCDNYQEALRSLERLRELDFEAVYVSHGWDIASGGKRAFLELLERLGSAS
jgi:glyoxylase-like metal-dependent hydrolase (beta-lactamase superfamily II)